MTLIRTEWRMTMFITKELNALTQLFQSKVPSQAVQQQLSLEYVNLEATLLRGKILRDFSKEKVAYIAQAEIVENDNNLAYLFAPFMIANLNQPVIYTTPVSSSVLKILNQYYQAEKSVNLKIEDVIHSLKLYIELVDDAKAEQDFLFRCLVKALCRTDIFHIFLVTHLSLDQQQIQILEDYFDVKIDVIHADRRPSMLNDELINTRRLLFKNKDEAPIKQGLQSIQNLAQKGYIPALMAVGNMFVNGNIVPQNLPEAKKIFASLAQENVAQAKESLAVVEKMMADQAKASNKATAKKS